VLTGFAYLLRMILWMVFEVETAHSRIYLVCVLCILNGYL